MSANHFKLRADHCARNIFLHARKVTDWSVSGSFRVTKTWLQPAQVEMLYEGLVQMRGQADEVATASTTSSPESSSPSSLISELAAEFEAANINTQDNQGVASDFNITSLEAGLEMTAGCAAMAARGESVPLSTPRARDSFQDGRAPTGVRVGLFYDPLEIFELPPQVDKTQDEQYAQESNPLCTPRACMSASSSESLSSSQTSEEAEEVHVAAVKHTEQSFVVRQEPFPPGSVATRTRASRRVQAA